MRIQGFAILLSLAVSLSAQQTGAPALDAAPPVQTEYGGPAILSRGGTSTLRAPSQSIQFRPFLTLTGAYDTGITPVGVSATGRIPDESSYGGDIEGGLLGYHRWKTASLALDYRGSYHHYVKNSYYNGTDQTLALVFTKQPTRRIRYSLREAAGVYNREFNILGTPLIDPSFINLPLNELFDGRALYLNTLGDLTYQKSARLSFNFGGDGFLVRRRSSALYGVTGYRARGDFAYRTSRYATSGMAYDFTHFEYTKGFGGTDVHTVQFIQAFRIGRYWELSMRAGGSRVETLGLTQVTIDPAIAAIIGRSTGVEVIYRINWVPTASANLSRSFRHSGISFGYSRGVSPGNGVYLTSRQESGSASYSYTGIRKLNIGLSGGYTSYGSLTQTLGKYSGFSGGGGFTYNLTRAFYWVTRYDYRHYDVQETTFKRNSYRASIGFGFSPGDVPLSLW